MKKVLNYFGLYTKYQLHELIKQSSSATVKGCFDYIQSDNIIIQDKETGLEIKGAELSQAEKQTRSLTDYVYARLNANGIEIIRSCED